MALKGGAAVITVENRTDTGSLPGSKAQKRAKIQFLHGGGKVLFCDCCAPQFPALFTDREPWLLQNALEKSCVKSQTCSP